MSKNSTSKIHSTSPDSYMIVFPFKQEQTGVGIPFDEKMLETNAYVISKDIISVSTNKGKGAIGSWSVTLGSSKNYKALLHAGCWVMIYINDQQYNGDFKDGASINSGLKMVGMISSLRVIEQTTQDGTKSIRYELHGSDFQSFFQTTIYINEILAPAASKETGAIILFRYTDPQGIERHSFVSPDKFITTIFDAVIGRTAAQSAQISYASAGMVGGGISMPPEVTKRLTGKKGTFISTLVQQIQPGLPGITSPQPQLGQQFTLWSLLKTYSHTLINEMYSDLIINDEILSPGFVMRSIPFSSKDKKPDDSCNSILDKSAEIQILTSKFIKEHEIMALNYGKSDTERFNFFIISSPVATTGGFSPSALFTATNELKDIGDENSIARYGLRPFISASEYCEGDVISSDNQLKRINSIVRDMWAPSHLYENGQAVLVGTHEHIPVGTNIEFEDRGWIAHVEAVSHSYHAEASGHKSFFTTISFVRLQTKDGEPIDMVGSNRSAQREFDRGVTHSKGNK